MKTLITIASLFVALALGAAIPAQTSQTGSPDFPSDSAILAILKERVDQGRSAGMVVGVLEADGSTRIVAWGDPGPEKLPLDRESVFEIGSITKVFTASVLADMVLKGEVSLDDPVRMCLPPEVTVPSRNGIEITLGMLSEQNSGLPRMPDNFAPADPSNPFADYDPHRLYEFLSGYELTRDPGESFEYSNVGVGLLGHALSLHAGMSYEEMVGDRILEPLGMTHSAITLTPWMLEHLALGHDPGGRVVSNWELDALAGAGAIRSTAEDMLKFLDAALHPERGSIQEAIAFAREARADAGDMRIGLNWISMYRGSDTIVWHNGGTGGYRTFAGIVPSRGIGVVVLTNTGGTGADDVGVHLLHPESPLAEPPSAWQAGLSILQALLLGRSWPGRLALLGVVVLVGLLGTGGARWVRRRRITA